MIDSKSQIYAVILLFIIGFVLVYGGLTTEYRVRYLHPFINCTEMDSYFAGLNLTGIRLVRVYHCTSNVHLGRYFISGVINIDDCYGYDWVMQHELRHHYCWQSERYMGHDGCFDGN